MRFAGNGRKCNRRSNLIIRRYIISRRFTVISSADILASVDAPIEYTTTKTCQLPSFPFGPGFTGNGGKSLAGKSGVPYLCVQLKCPKRFVNLRFAFTFFLIILFVCIFVCFVDLFYHLVSNISVHMITIQHMTPLRSSLIL